MKRGLKAGFVLVLLVVCAGLLYAQVRTPALRGLDRKTPVVGVPTGVDATGANAAGIFQEASGGAPPIPDAEPSEDLSKALRVVVQFLQLRPDQVQSFFQLLQVRQQSVGPLRRQIAERERQLHELLNSDGADPAAIGQLVIEIHQLRQLIRQAQETFLTGVNNLLDDDQQQRWHLIQLAERLQPYLPAFRALHLL